MPFSSSVSGPFFSNLSIPFKYESIAEFKADFTMPLTQPDHPTTITDQLTSCTGVGADMLTTKSVPAPNGGRDCFGCMRSATDDQPSDFAGITSGVSSPLALGSESTHDEASHSPSLMPPQHTTTPPEHFPNGPGDQPVDGEWLWVCSECGAGSWLMSTTEACLNCGHARCVNCASWEV